MKTFDQHIFVCTNIRDNDKESCGGSGALELLKYAKEHSAELGFKDKNIRISSSGCLGNCKSGPVLVVYPTGKWYTCKTTDDIDKIFENID